MDNQKETGAIPLMALEGEPLFVLTNQGCEDTGHWTPQQFQQLGLDYGEYDGQPYPLTDEEANCIGWDYLPTPAGSDLMFGYSALWKSQKWVMPSVEYCYNGASPSTEFVAEIERERVELQTLVEPFGGKAIYEEAGPPDRIIVVVLVSLQRIQDEFGSMQVWKRYIERGLIGQGETSYG